MQLAIADPDRYAIEGKVDGVRGLVTFDEGGRLGTHNRRGEPPHWLRGQPLGVRCGGSPTRLPILWHGTVLDGELVADRFVGTMSALYGSSGTATRCATSSSTSRSWPGSTSARCRGRSGESDSSCSPPAFEPPIVLSPLVEPCAELAQQILDGDLEGLVLKERSAPYRDGSRAGWWKVKDRSWYEREAWRFDRR